MRSGMPFFFGCIIVYGCFVFSNILKICAFSPNFPLVGSVVEGFYWLFLWNFKEIKHQPFSMTQPFLFQEITENGRTSFTVYYLYKKQGHELLHGLASIWDNA